MTPKLVAGAFVFVTAPSVAPDVEVFATVREVEGMTFVLRKEDADRYEMKYDYVAGWITLEAHSALDAVGLTAAVSRELTKAEISCNVLAGFFHDHLLVPLHRTQEALRVLAELSAKS